MCECNNNGDVVIPLTKSVCAEENMSEKVFLSCCILIIHGVVSKNTELFDNMTSDRFQPHIRLPSSSTPLEH